IEVVQFGDDAGGDLIEEKKFPGPLPGQIKSSLNYLDGSGGNLPRKIAGQAEVERTVAYPYEAMEEAIVNAFTVLLPGNFLTKCQELTSQRSLMRIFKKTSSCSSCESPHLVEREIVWLGPCAALGCVLSLPAVHVCRRIKPTHFHPQKTGR